MRIQIYIGIIILIAVTGYSQSVNPSFDQLGSKDGLNASYNDFFYLDSRGFTWISSLDGLHRYDGLELKKYLDGNIGKQGIRGKYIQSNLFENRAGNFWFSTFEWINYYDRQKDQFSAFQLENEEGKTISSEYCVFYLEQDSILWLKGGGSIYTFNIHTQFHQKVIATKGTRFTVDTLKDGSVKNIYGSLWDGGSGFEFINISSNDSIESKRFLKNGLPNQNINHIEIHEILIRDSNEIWLFSKEGMLGYEPQDNNFTLYRLPEQDNTVLDGTILNEKYLILGTSQKGIQLFDTQNKTWANFTEYNELSKLSSNSIREIYKTKENHLWVSNNMGENIDNSWLFNNKFRNPFAGIKQVNITAIVNDQNNKIWCATKNNGIYVFENDGHLVHQIIYDPSAKGEKIGSVSDIHDLSLGSNGELWAINNNSVFKFDTSLNGFRNVYMGDNKKIYDLIHLSSFNKKMILTDEGGFVLSPSLNDHSTFELGEKVIAEEESQTFQLFEGQDSLIYFPNNKNDLIIYKKGAQLLDSLGQIEFDQNINTIWEDKAVGALWIGTPSGLYKKEKGSSTFVSQFNDEDLLWKTPVYNISGDKRGRLWLSTNKGLWSYNVSANKCQQYQEEDGLPAGFSWSAKASNFENNIWIATTTGLAVFNPDSIEAYPYGPKIQLKNLKINSRPFETPNYIGECHDFQLKHTQNNFDFDFVAISSYLPKLNNIFYRLKEFNDKWQIVRNGQIIRLSQIPPGAYTLEVYGVNANGIKGKTESIQINISSPIWHKWWFWLSIVLVGIRIFVYVFNRKLQQQQLVFKREQEKQQLAFEHAKEKQQLVFEYEQEKQKITFEKEQDMKEALQEERNRIASEMHDDLGGGLNTIQILSKRIRKEALSENVLDNLQKIETYASKSIENMREIIWAMNSNYDVLPELIAYTRRFVLEYFEDHHLACKANVPDKFPIIPISGVKRRNIFLCVKESAHNIVKHAKAKSVEIKFEYENGLKITIKDNGNGFNQKIKKHSGYGLKNMRRRIEEVGGKMTIEQEKGTKIIFEIPISFKNKINHPKP